MDIRRWALGFVLTVMLVAAAPGRAQVFTVGEKSATADMELDFKPTRVDLPDAAMTVQGRRSLMRNLEAEQGFAHRVLPLGTVLTLQANGRLKIGDEEYKKVVYKKGSTAAAGDRVAVTAMEIKGDRINIDLNGGPYVKHRFLRHLQISVGGAQTAEPDLTEQATGCRIALVFEGGVPELSAPEVKALLEPLIDFGVKSGEQAYADTLPAPVKSAIDSHEVLVGMNHRMVLAALGQPENKVRETAAEGKYEEWIYGHQPQTVQFVRFTGDRVSLVKVAALGKPMEVRSQDEMAGYMPAALPGLSIRVKDGPVNDGKTAPPTLLKPGESAVGLDGLPVVSDQKKVQYPVEKKAPAKEMVGSPGLR